MKTTIFLFLTMFSFQASQGQIQLKIPGVKWDECYSFDKCNVFQVEDYSKNNDLLRTMHFKTYYQSDGKDFAVKMDSENSVTGIETVIDKTNEVAIQILGTTYYKAGGFKYPIDKELKKLEIIPTSEIKIILGFSCKKFTYTYKKLFGEIWITDQIDLSNDLGIFHAAKMTAVYNTLSVGGFVMEMTTEDIKVGKTIMKTLSLKNDEKYIVNLYGVKMGTAINKENYYTF